MIDKEILENWVAEQHDYLDSITKLLQQQAIDHSTYARESCERMRELNKMMSHYIEIQHTHISQYAKHIDGAVESRRLAQQSEAAALSLLEKSQAQNQVLIDIISKCANSGTNLHVGTINS